MFEEIGAIGSSKEKLSSYISSQNLISSNQESYSSLSQSRTISSISTTDTVDFDRSEIGEYGGSSDIEALTKSLSMNQGFEPGCHPSFSISSLNGLQNGLEKGIKSAGVFKPKY